MSELLCIDDSCILLSDKEPWEGLLWYRREEVSLRVVVGIQLTNIVVGVNT